MLNKVYGYKKINGFILTIVLIVIPVSLKSQDPSVVNLFNTGKMYVADNGGTSLYILKAMHVSGNNVGIVQNGKTRIGGNFYHDAGTNVFVTDSNGYGTGTGVFSFEDNAVPNTGNKRYITTRDVDISTFDRASHYGAFPVIRIATADTVALPGKMGIDVLSIERTNTGVLLLQSTVYNGTVVSDASLRFTANGVSESMAPAGSVVIERDMTLYRPSTGNAPLFAYASPFKTQRSGYFAGNWVRKLLRDNSFYDHTEYVYGNKSGNGTVIDKNQYLYDPEENFTVNNGYLIKARPLDFDFQQLINSGGLSITDSHSPAYDQSKFVFNGEVYTLPSVQEQVFADNILFDKTLSNASTSNKTVNWVVGNSYTCAINAQKLVNALGSSSLTFEPTVYVFPAGSTTYQPCRITGGALQVVNLEDIPAMSIFMVRLNRKTSTQTGNFKVDRSMLSHGNSGNNLRTSSYSDEILFRVTPEDNDNIYDLTVIGMRKNAGDGLDNMDVSKAYLSNNNAFQLYSLSSDNSKLSANALPEGSERSNLCLTPGETSIRLKLKAFRQESLENVWLEDLVTREIVDLKMTPEYTFNSEPSDIPERFVVHFTQVPAGLEKGTNTDLLCYYSSGHVVIQGLRDTDLGSVLTIIDMQGKVLKQMPVGQTPEMYVPADFPSGMLMAQLRGSRNVLLKFITVP